MRSSSFNLHPPPATQLAVDTGRDRFQHAPGSALRLAVCTLGSNTGLERVLPQRLQHLLVVRRLVKVFQSIVGSKTSRLPKHKALFSQIRRLNLACQVAFGRKVITE